MPGKSFSIEAVFKAIDKMSNPLKGMTRSTNQFSRSLRTDFAKTQKQVDNFSKNIKQNMGVAVKRTFLGLGVAAAGGLALLVKEASKIEDVVAGFTPLLGSVEKAEKLVSMLNDTAATTPFQLENISNAATLLLPAMNGDLEETVKTFRMLGDTAGGNVEKLNRISAVYSRVLLKNKLETGDLNILTERGIPIYKELSRSMGVSVSEMAKMASQGKITGKDVTKVFQQMTSKGGIFYKGMEIASATLTGRFSTLKDNVLLTAAVLGKQLLPILKPLLDKAIKLAVSVRAWADANSDLINKKLISGFKKVVDYAVKFYKVIKGIYSIIKPLAPAIIAVVAAFALYKTVLVAAAIATNVMVGAMKLYKTFQFLAMVATHGLTAAQAAFNGVAMANPIGVIIIAIIAFIAIITALTILIWKFRKQIIQFFITAWEVFNKLMRNPFFVIGLTIFAGYLLVPALIISRFKQLIPFFKFLGKVIFDALSTAFNGLKTAFKFVVDFIKTALFSFADFILTVYGNIFKTILGAAGKVGKFLGFDTSGIDNVLNKITAVQKTVREQSLVGKVQAANSGTQAPISASERTQLTRDESVSRGEVVIRDESGRAEVSKPAYGNGFNLSLQSSGGM